MIFGYDLLKKHFLGESHARTVDFEHSVVAPGYL